MNIGIIGNGFVGQATKLLKNKLINIQVYDIRPEACEPLGTQITDLENCDLVFYCLPTPINHNSNCYTKILEDSIPKLNNPFKVIRSTVPIGFSQSQNCFFMPEFLTEANWKNDFINSTHWIFGLLENNDILNEEFKSRIIKLFKISYNENVIKNDKIYWLTNSEAEFLKLSKNCFLASKVGIMNELYSLAKYKNINYDNVKEILKLDPRIGQTHMNVPGYKNLFGYGGTCFPKDTHSLYSQFQEANIPCYYFQTSLFRNEFLDRPEREWVNDYWRTTIPTDKKISLVINNIELCNELLNMNHIVIYLYNLDDNNFNHLLNNPNFILKKADLINKQFFPKLNYIWYQTQNDLVNYNFLQNNILYIMNILELTKTHNCELFINNRKENLTNNIIETLIDEYKKENPILSIHNIDSFANLNKLITN
jgi:UDPglucose 6-dehydrogenase